MASREIKYGDYVCKYTKLTTDINNVMDGFAVIGTDVTQRIHGVVTSDTEANLGTAITTFYKAFAKPRQMFTIIANGATWYSIKYDENDTAQDIHFGPIVESASVDSYLGRIAFTYTVVIKYRLKICDSASQINKILRLSRDESFAIDLNGFTRRTTEGHMIITHQARPADQYRALLNVDIPNGFKRVGQNFRTSDDGCRMDYSIVDDEIYWQLPNPVTSGQVDFNIGQEMGGLLTCTLSGQLSMGPNTPKSDVIDVIKTLHDAYFKKVWQNPTTEALNKSNSMTTSIFGNTIDFTFVKTGAGDLDIVNTDTFFKNLKAVTDTPPGNNANDVQTPIPPYGLGEMSVGQDGRIAHKLTPNNCDNPTTTGGTTPTSPPVTPPVSPGSNSSTPATLNNGITSEHKTNPYMDYSEKISWDTDNNIKVYYPITAGVNPIVQQTRQPKTFITQTGYATRLGKQPVVPPPVLGDQKPLQTSVDFINPSRVQGQKLFSVTWRYIMQVQAAAFTINGSTLPTDPRFTEASGNIENVDVKLSTHPN